MFFHLQPAGDSASVAKRKEGNALFGQGTNEGNGLAPVIRRSRLEAAIRVYREASKLASLYNERKMALRNAAVAAAHIVPLVQADQKLQAYWLGEGIELLSEARLASRAAARGRVTADWGDRMTKAEDTLHETFEQLTFECPDKRAIVQLCSLLHDKAALVPSLTVRIFICHVETLFKLAVEAIEAADFKRALSWLADCHRPLVEVLQVAGPDHPCHELCQAISGDVQHELCRAQSMQARDIADRLLHEHLQRDPELNLDLIWEGVVDRYRQAVLLCQERDVEGEAIAYARLGAVYRRVLKMDELAKRCFRRSLELATTIHANLHSFDWYNETATAVQFYRDEDERKAEREHRASRAGILEELKGVLDALEEAEGKGAAAFLEHVYTTHPPKNEAHKRKPEDSLRKQMRSAASHYHPDHNSEAKGCTLKHATLCEEICKIVNKFFQHFKETASDEPEQTSQQETPQQETPQQDTTQDGTDDKQ